MAPPAARRLKASELPWAVLRRPLRAEERAATESLLRRLLRWQRTLRAWPSLRGAPDATPFVSLYVDGRLRGCFGSGEGLPGERVARAFVRALEDARGGFVRPDERDRLVAQASFIRASERVDRLDDVIAKLEPGTHGLAFVRDGATPVLLLPSVARDGALTARGMTETLARKAGVPLDALAAGPFYLFETDDVVARPVRERARRSPSPRALAVEWLGRLVREDGFVHFGVDPRARDVMRVGLMHHGRAAVVIRALAAHGGDADDVRKARRWLAADIALSLRGGVVEGWPEDEAMVAGTVALGCLAGLPLQEELARMAGSAALRRSPWHAAQVVTVLGRAAPEDLWRTCVASLEAQPWAPWTVLAARARGDEAVVERAAVALEDSTRSAAPHEGGVAAKDLPETALTALTVEALAPLARASSRAALRRARRFLERAQLLPGRVPASLEPDLAEGAFPLTPVSTFLRGDVTAHALLALGSS